MKQREASKGLVSGGTPPKPSGRGSPAVSRASSPSVSASGKRPSSPLASTPKEIKSVEELLRLVKKPLSEIVALPEYQGILKQLSQRLKFEDELINHPEYVQWMHQNNLIKATHWEYLISEIIAGRHRQFLSYDTVFSVFLWSKFCAMLVKHTDFISLILSDNNLFKGFLWRAQLDHRIRLFEQADSELIGTLFKLSQQHAELRHIVYSVLTTCFRSITNENFYTVLVQYPQYHEFSLAVCNPQDLKKFVQENKSKPWCRKIQVQKKRVLRPTDLSFSKEDESRILGYLKGIRDDHKESGELSDQLLVQYFCLNNPDIRNAIFANPILVDRVIELRRSNQLSIQVQAHVFPLLQSMLSCRKSGNGQAVLYDHLFRSEEIAPIFVGAVELLFSQPQEEGNKPFLAELFQYFGPELFSGITTQQLVELQKIRGNYEVIFTTYAKASQVCQKRVEVYRALEYVKEDDVYKRWVETAKDDGRFVQEFKYGGPADNKRWQLFLSCAWKGGLSGKEVVNKIISFAESLCLGDFLRSIAKVRLYQLFSENKFLAENILKQKEIFARCNFVLEDFTHWDSRYLEMILADPELHKAYGFTARDFYRVIQSDQEGHTFAVDGEREGYFGQLLSRNKMDDSARSFLVQTFLEAPPEVKVVLKRWLNIKVRQLLMKFVSDRVDVLGFKASELSGVLNGEIKVKDDHEILALARLSDYLQDEKSSQEDDFIKNLLVSDHFKQFVGDGFKDLVGGALSGAPPCIQALANEGNLFSKKVEGGRIEGLPWCAEGVAYKGYGFDEAFQDEENKLNARKNKLSQNSTPQQIQSFIDAIWIANCDFMTKMFQNPQIKQRLEDESADMNNGEKSLANLRSALEGTVQQVRNNVGSVLNNNILARRVGLMHNPRWLKIGLANHLRGDFKHVELFVVSFLNLPEFRPTTSDLSPCFFATEKAYNAFQIMSRDKPFVMIEYLIDLCQFNFDVFNENMKLKEDVYNKAIDLVSRGLVSAFGKIPDAVKVDVEAHTVKRFICLCVCAAGFLKLTDFVALFDRNTDIRDQLCKWLLEYKMLRQAALPAFLRLQLILLQSYSHSVELPQSPTEQQLSEWQASQTFVNDIVWQLSIAPVKAFETLQVQDYLDGQTLSRLENFGVRQKLAHLIPKNVRPVKRTLHFDEQDDVLVGGVSESSAPLGQAHIRPALEPAQENGAGETFSLF